MGFLDKFFKISERNSTISTEVMGGITTFLAMSYIIIVNPSILSISGMDKGALITVTIISTVFGTLLSGLYANVPIALAPGMGLNAFFTFTLVLEKGVSWQVALGMVFISGVFFLILSLGGIREKIADAIPYDLKIAVGGGIGLFIAFIGLKAMGLIVANPATFVSIGPFTKTLCISIVGLFVVIIMEVKKMKGGILIGIILTTILAILFGEVELPKEIISRPPSIAPIAFKLDIKGALQISLLGPIFSFMFVDLFDSLGTLISCAKEMNMLDKNGKVKDLGKMLYTDVASTIVGATLGTSTVTSFVESAAGIGAGARTGLSSVVTSIGFLLALFFAPLILIVPGYATAPALIIVGIYMFKQLVSLNFSDLKILFPAFVIIFTMPLTYSISTGIALGFLAYIIIHLVTGDFRKLNIPLVFIGIICLIHTIV
ncbi:MAG: NCS2 family permease [Fusobacterium sp.]|uniref:NCS2 family permease n=1 Tax=Fusobacterium sp. TaxID=68766 RepID=UPI0026DB2056|nr:NCS2 family permease [Fusobacterium sp.]MDO4690694.1 NCS2 family permease [Fusobacterium sp.]